MKNSGMFLSVTLPVASFFIKINTNSHSLIDYLKEVHANENETTLKSNASLLFTVFEDDKGQYHFQCPQIKFNLLIHNQAQTQQNWCVIEAVKIISQYYFLSKGVLFLHGSAVAVDGRGYVFAGVSGSGKTTISDIAAGEGKIADDQVVLGKVKGKYYLYSCIFDAKLKKPNYQKIPLADIFLLVKSKSLAIKPMADIGLILSFLVNNDLFNAAFEFYLSQNEEESKLHFSIASKLHLPDFKEKQFRFYLQLYKRAHFYRLFFPKDITKKKLFPALRNLVANQKKTDYHKDND